MLEVRGRYPGPPERVAAIKGCLSLFRQGSQVALLLLGMMAAAISAIQLGLLRMLPLQAWLNAFHLNTKRDRHLTADHVTRARQPYAGGG
ncbi:UNVERIFIED_CONTAM: hypothetical protein FKN15_052950 [Acipenser sinensis]